SVVATTSLHVPFSATTQSIRRGESREQSVTAVVQAPQSLANAPATVFALVMSSVVFLLAAADPVNAAIALVIRSCTACAEYTFTRFISMENSITSPPCAKQYPDRVLTS